MYSVGERVFSLGEWVYLLNVYDEGYVGVGKVVSKIDVIYNSIEVGVWPLSSKALYLYQSGIGYYGEGDVCDWEVEYILKVPEKTLRVLI